MEEYPLILRKLSRQRRLPLPGQVFSFSDKEDRFWFGRVIRTDVPMMGGHVSLVYLYTATSTSPSDVPPLTRDQLMGPPQLLGVRAWRQGYLSLGQVNSPNAAELLDRHVFFNPFWQQKWIDIATLEYVPDPGHPCGLYGSGSIGAVNAALCAHLGVSMQPWPREE